MREVRGTVKHVEPEERTEYWEGEITLTTLETPFGELLQKLPKKSPMSVSVSESHLSTCVHAPTHIHRSCVCMHLHTDQHIYAHSNPPHTHKHKNPKITYMNKENRFLKI